MQALQKKTPNAKLKNVHTVGVLAEAGANGALLLEVDVPVGSLTRLVLKGECKDSLAVLDGILAAGIVAAESGVDGLEGLGGREGVCERGRERTRAQQISLLSFCYCWLGMGLPFLRDMVGGEESGKCDDGRRRAEERVYE